MSLVLCGWRLSRFGTRLAYIVYSTRNRPNVGRLIISHDLEVTAGLVSPRIDSVCRGDCPNQDSNDDVLSRGSESGRRIIFFKISSQRDSLGRM